MQGDNALAVGLLFAIVGLCVVLGLSTAAGAGSAECRWRLVVDSSGPALTGVSVLADGSVWAVGNDGLHASFLSRAGGRWRRMRSPVFALDVAAVSADDVWAVGASRPGLAGVALAERWHRGRWRRVSVGGRPAEYLRALAAPAANDVWAVGANDRGGPLLEHWQGRNWMRLTGGPAHGILQAVQALSSGAVWAVGTQGMQTLGSKDERPLVERLTASGWHTVPTPTLDWLNVNLFAVQLLSPSEAFTTGAIDLDGGIPFVLRWNGHTWTPLTTSGLPPTDVSLTAIAAFGSDDLWVAGSHGLAGAERPLLAHWHDGHWSQASTRGHGSLSALAALSPRDIWAAGSSLQPAGNTHSLLEHYSCT